jgi:hypothetical protein
MHKGELVHRLGDEAGLPKIVDAVVLVSMGEMARDPLVDYAVASVRKAGKWKGEVYLLTDSPKCFTNTASEYKVQVVPIPTKQSLMDIKSLKAKLLDHVPEHVQSVLYLDVDIVVARELDYFLNMIGRDLARNNNNSTSTRPFDFAAFGDAKGHYVGFCAGCEKWHTGVMILRRGQGSKCLQAWADLLKSGRYGTDQESLDAAERSGACRKAYMLPSQYLLFAKDYIAALLTTGHTFVHVTSAARLGQQDSFYRSFVVPRIRGAMRGQLDDVKILGGGIKAC